MPGVFVSYRREDSAGHTGRLFDRLRTRLGDDRVFMDTTAIEAGDDFAASIDLAIQSCDVLLAVIGPSWLTSAAPGGGPRLNDPSDFVRLEIATALKRDVRVVPVLIAGATLPAAHDLSTDLQALVRRQAMELRDARWDADADDLIRVLERHLGVSTPGGHRDRPPRSTRILIAAAAGLVGAVALAAAWYVHRDRAAPPVAASVTIPVERTLSYAIAIRSHSAGGAKSSDLVTAGRVLSAGDAVRFSFSSPQSGFLYLFDESAPGKNGRVTFNILFPSPTSNNGSAQVAAGQPLSIPALGDGFIVDASEGIEKVWVIWSTNVIEQLGALGRWANPEDKGQIKSASDIVVVRDFIARHSSQPSRVQKTDGATTTITGRDDVLVELVTLDHRR